MEKEIDCVICERPDGSYIKTNNGELKIITKNRCDTLNIKRYRIKKAGVVHYPIQKGNQLIQKI